MTKQREIPAIGIVLALMASMPSFAESSHSIVGEIMAAGVAASGKSADGDEDADRSGGISGAGISYARDRGADHLDVALSSTYFAYKEPARIDLWSNDVSGGYGRDLSSDLRLSGLAAYTTQLLTLESASADQKQLRTRLAWSPGPHRLRATGGWRWRDYRDLVDGEGEGSTTTLDYRYRMRRGRYFSVSARYEEIDSNIDRADYRRTTLSVEYGFRLSRKTDAVIGVEWRDWTYLHRTIERGLQRQDQRIAPTLFITHDFGNGWFGEFEGIAIYRDSNSDRYDETIRRATLTVRKRFEL